MKVKGTCYFSHLHKEHVIIILSDSDEDNNALVVPLSSIKFKENGKYRYKDNLCLPYDTSCIIEAGEIISDKGENVIKKPTYALYKLASVISEESIKKNMLDKDRLLKYRCIIDDNLLTRLQIGAKNSKFLPNKLKKYFDLF